MTMRAPTRLAKALLSLTAAGAVSAGAIAMSGCGASAALDPVARAAQVTSNQEGARVAMTMQFSSSALSGGFAIKADGYLDERHRSGQMTMDLSGLPGLSALGGGTAKVQLIFQYPVIYMNMPFLAGRLPGGKTWMKLDVTKAAKAAGIETSQFSTLGQADPTQFLQYLRGSGGNVTTVGSETLNGVPTTHYRGTLQLSRILEHLPSSEREAAKSALEKLVNGGSIPVDVWVDGQGRLRRIQMSLGVNLPAGSTSGASANGTITVDFTSYGPVPPITAPPASQVFDATAFATGALSGTQAAP
jgi:hypothetical protein